MTPVLNNLARLYLSANPRRSGYRLLLTVSILTIVLVLASKGTESKRDYAF